MAGATGEWSASRSRVGVGQRGARVLGLVAATLFVMLGVACGSGDLPPGIGSGAGNGPAIGPAGPDPAGKPSNVKVGPCAAEGVIRECHVLVGQHAGITNCFNGVQRCESGFWSQCAEGEFTVKAKFTDAPFPMGQQADPSQIAPEGTNAQGALGGVRVGEVEAPTVVPGEDDEAQVLYTPLGSCNDPCDPTCQRLGDGSYGLGGTPVASWGSAPGASLANANAIAQKAYNEPCETGSDCQFNTYCKNPITDASCAHDKCAVGAPLTGTCATNDRCVAQVCAQNPNCCTVGKQWDGACTGLVKSLCAIDCPDNAPSCAHDLCATGGGLTSGCDACVTAVCAANATCCGGAGTWSSTCINLIPTVCGYACPPASAQGKCVPYLAGQSDLTCNGFDLTVGIPCYDATQGQKTVPVCNVGTQPTPAGKTITIEQYAANSGHVPEWPPTGPSSQIKNACSATVQIQPGQCVNVVCNTDKNGEVVINREGTTGFANTNFIPGECNFTNNWSVNVDPSASSFVQCAAPTCGGATGVASGAHRFVLEVENSSLMPAAQWTNTRSGVNSFINQFASAPFSSTGAKTQIGMFPDSTTSCTTATCGGTAKCVKTGAMTTINGNTGTLTGTLPTAQPGLGSNPPYVDGYRGALVAAQAAQATGVFNSVILVLGSDLEFIGNGYCSTTLNAMTGLADFYWQNYGIRTFVVAVGAAQLSTAQKIANAGHGRGYYVANDANLSTNLQAKLTSAFDFTNNACQFPVPLPTQFDLQATTINFKTPAGPTSTSPSMRYSSVTAVTQVQPNPVTLASMLLQGYTYLDACLQNCPSPLAAPGAASVTGWCYDDPIAPSSIYLCRNTCEALVADPNSGTIDYNIQCPNVYNTGTYPVTTAYPGFNCNSIPGTRTLWSYLAYDTSDPLGTSVTFQFRTTSAVNGVCPALASFPAASPQWCDASQPCPAGQTCSNNQCSAAFTVTASQTSSTGQVCSIGQGGGCPIDLVKWMNGDSTGNRLSGPMLNDCLWLDVKLNPNLLKTQAPKVNSFELRYSCPYAE